MDRHGENLVGDITAPLILNAFRINREMGCPLRRCAPLASPHVGDRQVARSLFVAEVYFSLKKSRLWKAAVMKRQAALPVVSHSMWALFLVLASMPFTKCSATTSG